MPQRGPLVASRGHRRAFLSLVKRMYIAQNGAVVPRSLFLSLRVTVVPILNRYVSRICAKVLGTLECRGTNTRGSWHIRRRRFLKRDGARREEKRVRKAEAREAGAIANVRNYKTRETIAVPGLISSVLGSDNTANLKARVGFIILAVSDLYASREYLAAPIQPYGRT